jgi:hypothetical protein
MTRPGRGQNAVARAAKSAEDEDYVGPQHRRSSGLLRIPFVQRCHLRFEQGSEASAFMVNVNVLGAYLAYEEQPLMGEAVECRFSLPGNEIEIVAGGVVAWLNPQQSHPVHSLPPGFGVRFERLTEWDKDRIAEMVRRYVARSTRKRR